VRHRGAITAQPTMFMVAPTAMFDQLKPFSMGAIVDSFLSGGGGSKDTGVEPGIDWWVSGGTGGMLALKRRWEGWEVPRSSSQPQKLGGPQLVQCGWAGWAARLTQAHGPRLAGMSRPLES
jgi:hypothetical protein